MTKARSKKLGRPAKYVKPFVASYRVSQAHLARVKELRGILTVGSNSDIIEEAVAALYKRKTGKAQP